MATKNTIPPKRAAEIARALLQLADGQVAAADLIGISQGTLTEYLGERSGMGLSTYKAAMRVITDYEERTKFLGQWLKSQVTGHDRLRIFTLITETREGPGGGAAKLLTRNGTRHQKQDVFGLAAEITKAHLGWGMIVNGDALIFYTHAPPEKTGTRYTIYYHDREHLETAGGAEWRLDPLVGDH